MKEYIDKQKIIKIARSNLKTCDPEELASFVSKIEEHKPAAVYCVFPGVKLGTIAGMNEELSSLRYEEETVISVYKYGNDVLVRTDKENEYTYDEVMENTDVVRADGCTILTDEPFITTANLASHVKELIGFWNDTNMSASEFKAQEGETL